jgi:L-rhamnose isomerase
VTATDELQALAREVTRAETRQRIWIGMDYFDASINRVAAWVIGARNVLRSLLAALLEPVDRIEAAERDGDFTSRLALQEEAKAMPFSLVWDEHCDRKNVPIADRWLSDVKQRETAILRLRSEP